MANRMNNLHRPTRHLDPLQRRDQALLKGIALLLLTAGALAFVITHK